MSVCRPESMPDDNRLKSRKAIQTTDHCGLYGFSIFLHMQDSIPSPPTLPTVKRFASQTAEHPARMTLLSSAVSYLSL